MPVERTDNNVIQFSKQQRRPPTSLLPRPTQPILLIKNLPPSAMPATLPAAPPPADDRLGLIEIGCIAGMTALPVAAGYGGNGLAWSATVLISGWCAAATALSVHQAEFTDRRSRQTTGVVVGMAFTIIASGAGLAYRAISPMPDEALTIMQPSPGDQPIRPSSEPPALDCRRVPSGYTCN